MDKKPIDPRVGSAISVRQWRQGLFLTVPKEHAKKGDARIVTYVTAKDLFQDFSASIEDTRRVLQGFKTQEVLNYCTLLNFLLRDKQASIDKREKFWARELLSASALDRLIELTEDVPRKIFPRQQLLVTLKWILSRHTEGTLIIKEHPHVLAEALFGISEHLEHDWPGRKEDTTLSPKVLAHFMRTLDLVDASLFKHQLCRFWSIYGDCLAEAKQRFPGSHFDLDGEFKSITGYSLKAYIAMAFGVWSHYANLTNARIKKEQGAYCIGKTFFQNLNPELSNASTEFFRLLSCTRQGFEQRFDRGDINDTYDLNVFWDKPLLELDDGRYMLLDALYLQDKITDGARWLVFDHLLDCEKREKDEPLRGKIREKRNQLQATIGRAFEIYASRLIRRVFPCSQILVKRLWLESEGDATGGVDAIVSYHNRLLLFEFTTSTIRHKTIMSGDPNKIISEIHNHIFFSGEGRKSRGKITQLLDARKKLLSGEVTLAGCDIAKVGRIIPVIVFLRKPPTFPGIWKIYADILQKKLSGDDLKWAEDVQMLEVEELEYMEDLANRSGSTFVDLLEGKIDSAFNHDSFRNYLVFQLKKGVRSVSIHDQLASLSKAITDLCFGNDKKAAPPGSSESEPS